MKRNQKQQWSVICISPCCLGMSLLRHRVEPEPCACMCTIVDAHITNLNLRQITILEEMECRKARKMRQ